MTEAEWLACAEPEAMLKHLKGRTGQRKSRLFVASCCLLLRPLLGDVEQTPPGSAERRLFTLINKLERDADSSLPGLSFPFIEWEFPGQELSPLIRAVYKAVQHAFCWGGWEWALPTARQCVEAFRVAGDTPSSRSDLRRVGPYGEAMSNLLRDVVGNPFHPVPPPDPAWLARDSAAVVKLAQAIYDGRRFSDLPILADALEDAGCDSPEVLSHCRAGGEHARGCWTLDWVLGRG